MFTIGQFSRISGLTIKTLRFYHEKRLLVPLCVDEETGYRYYSESNVERARVIAALRELGFSVADVGEILSQCDDESDLIEYLQHRKAAIEERICNDRKVLGQLNAIISSEREARIMAEQATYEVEEKVLVPMWIAGARMKGRYSDCGKGFARLGRAVGRYVCGKPMNLYYDDEYREDDADMEPCFPVKSGAKASDGISIRELPGGHCVALLHRGPYDELGRSYEKIFAYMERKGYRPTLPSREIYLKGPGMIFRGNPRKYLTEIQVLIKG